MYRSPTLRLTLLVISLIVASCSSSGAGDASSSSPSDDTLAPLSIDPDSTSTADSAPPQAPPVVDPATVVSFVGACIDDTQSVTPEFFATAQTLVADGLELLAPETNGSSLESVGAQPEHPAVALSVRTFDDNSYETANDIVSATVPGVDALGPEPTIDDFPQTLSDELALWQSEQITRSQALHEAQSVLAAATDEIRSATYGHVFGTDLAGCISAHLELSRTYERAEEVLLLIASDMEAFGEQQALSGRFDADIDTEVYVIQDCTDASECQDVQQEWTGTFEDTWGADSVTWSRSEVAQTTVSQAIAGLRSR